MRKSPIRNGASSSTLQQVTFLLLLLAGALFIQATWGSTRLSSVSNGENSDQLSAAASAILAYEPTETTVTGSTNTTVQTTSVGGLSASGGVNGTALGGSGTVNAGTGVSGSFGSGGTLNASGNANTGGSSGSSLLGNDTGSGAGSWSAFQSWATGGTSDGSGSNNNTNKNTSVWSNVWSTTNSGGSAVRNGTSLTGGSAGQAQQDPNYFSVAAKNLWGSLVGGVAAPTQALPNSSYLFYPTSLTNTAPSLVGGRYFSTGFFSSQSVVLNPSAGNLVGGNVLPTSLQTGVNTVPVTGFSGSGAAMTDTSINIVTTLTGTWKGVQKATSDLGTQIVDMTNGLLTNRDLSTVRGIRNNNPGNIACSGVQWNGATGCDGDFVTFGPIDATCDAQCAGIRAGLINLKNQQVMHGVNTISGILNKWAPSSQNPTDSYIAQITSITGYSADQQLDLTDPVVAAKVFTAMIKVENGGVPYTQEQILSGVNAAFGTSAGTNHSLVSDIHSPEITVLNTTTNTPEGAIQTAPNPSDQPLNQQVVEIAGKAFMDGLTNVVTGKQSPNEAIAGAVIGATGQVLTRVFSTGGVSVPVSPDAQKVWENAGGMLLQYAPGIGGGASNSALDAINTVAGPPTQTQPKPAVVSDANATANVIINDDKRDNGYTPTVTAAKSGAVGNFLGNIVNSGFNLIKSAYSSGSGDTEPKSGLSASGGVNGSSNTTKPGGSVTLKPTDLSGGFTVPVDRTQTGSFVKADPVTGKPVATPTTPSGVYYDRGLAVALELNTKEQALKKAGVDYTVKDGEIYVTTNESTGKTVLPTETQVVNSPEYQSGVMTFIKGTNLNIDKLAPKDQKTLIAVIPGMIRIGNDTTLSDDDKKAQVQALLKAEGLDPLKLLGIVPADAVQKGFLGIPTGVDQTKLGFGDQTEATAKMQEIYDNAAKTLTKAEPGSTVSKVTSFDSLSSEERAKLGVSDTEYQKIQKISDTAFGATGGDTATPVKMTLMKVVNTTEEDAKCRSSFVCSIAVAPFGGVEGVRKILEKAAGTGSGTQQYIGLGSNPTVDSSGYIQAPGVTYGLSGKVRDLPPSEKFLNQLIVARDATDPNITVKILSGGQPSDCTSANAAARPDCIGSSRHDVDSTGYSNTADVELYLNGNLIDPSLAENKSLYAKFVKNAAAAGFTGIGVGEDGHMTHLGGGDVAFWGYGPDGGYSKYADPTYTQAFYEGNKQLANGGGLAAIDAATQITNTPAGIALNLFSKAFPKPQEIVVDSGTAQKFINPGQPTETPIVSGGGTGGGGQPGATTPGQNAGDLINPWANGGSGGNNNGGGRGTTSTTTVATSTNNFIGNFLGGLFGGLGGGRNGASNNAGQSGDVGSSITGLVGNIFGTILGGVTGSPSGGVNGIGGILQGFGNIFGNVFGQALNGNNAGGTGQNGGATGYQNQDVTPLVAQRPDIVCNPNAVRANQPAAVTVSWVCYGSESADGIGFPIRGGAPAANIVINVGATSTSWLSYGIRCSNGTTRSCVIPVNQ